MSRGATAMPAASLAYYGLAVVVTATFVQAFQAWQLLVAGIGKAAAGQVPFAAAAAAVAAVVAAGWRNRSGWQWPVVAAAAAAIAAGLWITDAAFPAKRIHVAEYMLLSLVVRRGASRHADGWALTVTTAVLTLLFGIHDELAQGIHPSRTFGLTDIVVDAMGGLAGALAGHTLGLFHRRPGADRGWPEAGPWLLSALAVAVALALMLAGIAASIPDSDQLAALMPLPLWPVAPVPAAVAVALLLDPPRRPWLRHAGAVALWLTAATILSPVVAHAVPLAFR